MLEFSILAQSASRHLFRSMAMFAYPQPPPFRRGRLLRSLPNFRSSSSRNSAMPAWYWSRSALFKYLGGSGNHLTTSLPSSPSKTSQVNLLTWNFILPSPHLGRGSPDRRMVVSHRVRPPASRIAPLPVKLRHDTQKTSS